MKPPFDSAALRAKASRGRGEVWERQQHQILLGPEHKDWPPIFTWCEAQVPDGVVWSRHRDMETGRITLTFSCSRTAMWCAMSL